MELNRLLRDIQFVLLKGNIDRTVSGICYDSRKVKANCLFVCVKGTKVNGHSYVNEAIKNGATAVVIEENIQYEKLEQDVTIIMVKNTKAALACVANIFYNEPSKEINLVGVTGTNGKTTVIHYIRNVLEGYGRKAGLIGTLGYELEGEKIEIDKTNPTTPESLELQEVLREFINKGAEDVVMEVTSSALAKHRVDYCDFNIGVFTNLSQDHLEEHGTMDAYKNEKMKLFYKCNIGIINADDKISKEIVEKATCAIVTYAIDAEADIKAFHIQYSNNSVSFKVNIKSFIRSVTVNIPGKFSVYNVLATIGTCYALGLNIDEILNIIAEVKPVPGRLEMVKNNVYRHVIVDYAHTPDALEKLLLMAKEITKGRLITVFGCGGDRDKTKRPIMGRIAGSIADHCIITSDNPRTENPESIIDDIESGIKQTAVSYEKIKDRRMAISKALEILEEEDLLIIAGKGHEDYQIIGNTKIHFDDKEVVSEILSRKVI